MKNVFAVCELVVLVAKTAEEQAQYFVLTPKTEKLSDRLSRALANWRERFSTHVYGARGVGANQCP